MENRVCKLNKAVYGLKQAPLAWFTNLHSFFLHNGFQRTRNDPTLYTKKDCANRLLLLVCVFVDDALVSDGGFGAAAFPSRLRDQARRMQGCSPPSQPIQHDQLQSRDYENLQVDDSISDASSFTSLVEGLITLTHTRPDIAYAVGVVARSRHDPTKHNFEAGTRDMVFEL